MRPSPRVRLLFFLLFVSAGLLALPALAAGPVDGEVGAVYWVNDFSVSEGGAGASASGDAPGYRAELWLFHRYGLQAAAYSSDLGDVGVDSADSLNVDLMWRAFAPAENSFLAVGAGWQQMDLATIGLDGDTSGPRVALEGRVGLLGPFYLYGRGSYLPELEDTPATDPTLGRFEDLSGYEVDLGVSWTVLPFLALRAGYRTQAIDFTRTGYIALPGEPPQMDGEVESAGYLAGLGIKF